MTAPRVSVAVPLHNEEAVVPELLHRLGAVLDALPGGPHEIVFVDDGSTDRTFDLVAAAAVRDTRIVALSLSRNFGHQAALTAALDEVRGDLVALMDGDLQDPPEALPTLLAGLAAGNDVAYARRVRRKEGLLLRLAYDLFYRLITRLSRIPLPLDAGDFSVMTRRVVDAMRRSPEHHRYLRGLRTWVGFRQTGVDVERAERFAGQSKYSYGALFRLAFDGIFAFSTAPLRAAALIGALAIALSTLFALYAIYVRVALDRSPEGFTALIVVMTFLSGMNLFFLGVIGEYLGRVYEETKARPLYVLSRIVREGREQSSVGARGAG